MILELVLQLVFEAVVYPVIWLFANVLIGVQNLFRRLLRKGQVSYRPWRERPHRERP